MFNGTANVVESGEVYISVDLCGYASSSEMSFRKKFSLFKRETLKTYLRSEVVELWDSSMYYIDGEEIVSTGIHKL